jgi:sulfatase modifying factor 1
MHFRALDISIVRAAWVAVCLCGVGAQAEVAIDTVTIGNPGNGGELSGEGAGGYGPDRICGAVDYTYNIGKFEVTAGQYTEFLNAVAADDTYGLYSVSMWSNDYGCKIERTGSPGSYTYSVASDWAGRPVDYVSWGDAARFANWLHNGQPTGAQDLSTTEDGSYFLNGVTDWDGLLAVVREPDATWVIPSEDEWYKAAYHKNDGVTGNYWDYPTSSDTWPSNDLIDPDPGNNANFYIDPDDYTIGNPYWRTEVGEFENSDSPYGTFDQGGNVWEWNEAILAEYQRRAMRGGAFSDIDPNGTRPYHLHAALRRECAYPMYQWYDLGFRVVDQNPQCPGDVNGSGHTGQVDLGILLAVWGTCEGDPDYDPRADLNCDGCVNQPDLGILLADWGCGT